MLNSPARESPLSQAQNYLVKGHFGTPQEIKLPWDGAHVLLNVTSLRITFFGTGMRRRQARHHGHGLSQRRSCIGCTWGIYMDLHGVPWGNLAHWHQKWRFIHPPVSNAGHHERTLGQSNVAIENARPFIHDFPRYRAPLIRDSQIATFDFRRADQISWQNHVFAISINHIMQQCMARGPIYMQYGCGVGDQSIPCSHDTNDPHTI